VLKDSDSPALLAAAHVVEPTTGRALDVYTTELTIHFYSGNSLDETLRGIGGGIYLQRAGFALETQHLPDSPNHPSFLGAVLRPGQVLRSTTIFRLSVPS
jgi:aldose 1-epimerase